MTLPRAILAKDVLVHGHDDLLSLLLHDDLLQMCRSSEKKKFRAQAQPILEPWYDGRMRSFQNMLHPDTVVARDPSY